MGVRLVNVVWVLLLLAGCSLIGSGGVEIIKPESDSREYRYLELPNQMKVVLISDADTDKAAVSLDVNVGSGADPVDRPGLAHFLEHMLFLGTERYPEAGEYQAFISGKGGSHNAYTSFEHTNYFFDIDSAYLEPAMDRFSQFFVAPLFTERYVEREKNAVHSEYMAKIKDDSRRMFEVLKGAVNPEHPFSKFTVGNLETLAERPGDSVRDRLLAFYKQHYSANLMTLVVHGKESLDELEAMVNARFSEVPNYQRDKTVITEPLFREGALPMQIQLQPEQSKRLLTLMFPLPDVEPFYRSKPLQLISHIVGHEGKGSLLSFLKQQGWAEGLSAGEGVGYRGGSSFSVMVQLTESGVAARDDVVAAVMQTLQLLRDQGVPRWLFEEERAIAEQNFRFHEERPPIDTVSSLANSLHRYPPQLLLRGPYLLDEYRPELVSMLLERMVVENLLVTLVTPDAEVSEQSLRYHVPYSKQSVAEEQLQRWRSGVGSDLIALPQPNPFVATDLSLLPLDSHEEKPQLIAEQGVLELWYLQDGQFKTPKLQVMASLRSPRASQTPRDAVMSQLWVELAKDALTELSYPAYLAGLNYSLNSHTRGISVKVGGFDHKLPELFERSLKTLLAAPFAEERFRSLQTELARRLENSAKQAPYKLLMGELGNQLYRQQWSDAEMLAALQSVTLKELEAYRGEFLLQLSVDMLVHGNANQAEALQLSERLQTLLEESRLVAAPAVEILNLAGEERGLEVPSSHSDASLVLYLQGEELGKRERALMGLTVQMQQANFYTSLRTEQQLGYIVFASAYPVQEVAGMIYLVQSPVASVADLKDAFDHFVTEWFERSVGDQAWFDGHRQALIQRLQEQPKNLGEAAHRYWQEIAYGEENFDSREQLVAELKSLTLSEWQTFYRQLFLQGSNRFWLYTKGNKRGAEALPAPMSAGAASYYAFP